MKKILFFISIFTLASGMTFAQHGGHHGNNGTPGDSTVVCDSTGVVLPHGNHGTPGDSTVVCDSTGVGHPHGGHGFPGGMGNLNDSTFMSHHGGTNFGGHHGGGTCDSTAVCDSTGVGHPFGGSHGHHGDGVCDSMVVIVDDSSVIEKALVILSDVSAYPNPVVSEVNVSFYSSVSEVVAIELYTITGQAVYAQSFYSTEGNNLLTIDMSSYPKGNYIVRIQQGNQILTNKILK